ncbi:hypothetical protein IKF43_02090 [Candidatus Saccharibacteria bacterium]|nr:hypothetical protein [Candidatus Saccharibacteria bacterium]
MRVTKNKSLIFCLLLCLCANLFFTLSASATQPLSALRINPGSIKNIPSNQIKKVFSSYGKSYNITGGTNGGTVTENYYVYSNCIKKNTKQYCGASGNGTIYFIDRSTGKLAKKVQNQRFNHLNNLNYVWGSKYIRVHQTGKDLCVGIKTGKVYKGSKCQKSSSRFGIDPYSSGHAPLFNNKYYFQGMNTSSDYSIIAIYNKSKRRKAVYKIKNRDIQKCPLHELESVSLDGDTGDVYVNFKCQYYPNAYMQIYKIKAAAFGKYTKVTKKTNGKKPNNNSNNSNGSNNSNNTKPTSNTPTQGPTQPQTAILKVDNIEDLLQLIVDILVIGIPILGIIGITIVGIQYLTAGGDETKTRKAKRRMLEIIIGLVAYVVIFALLQWLGVGN